MSWSRLLLFLHIMSAIMLIGGIFARQVVRAYAKNSTDVKIISELYNAAGRIEAVMIRPFNGLVILFGVIYALMIGAPIFGFLQGAEQNWLLVTNILVLLIPFPIIFFFIPRGKIFEPIMRDALAKGQVTPELREQLHDPAMKRMHQVEMAGVVFVVILMVFKPF
ncbi:MAG: hypothetical protein C3F07_13190 [Anaerolineales bacterium]|nr:DUF2269 family protein [Anaerolineae bacterium]PWB71709.1 MAG: hypothetical protein C3F07_13190 [Anaerolineales bacterium]